jgi:CheY-like chemotaxis protein
MARGNILVVEDDETIRRLLMEYLAEHSYLSVDGARDGIEALHRLALQPYHLIVLDLLMPKMSGVDFLDSLNAMSSDPSVKSIETPPNVIVITSATEDDLPTRTIASRCELVRDVMRKPIDVKRLAEVIEGYVADA